MTSIHKTPTIDIQNMSYIKNKTTILKQVNFTIFENDFVVLIGPNGGGKTTLIKLILNLIQPTKGSISVFGKSSIHTAQNISYVPQEINTNKNFPITVIDVVSMGNKNTKKLNKFKIQKSRLEALKALEKMEVVQHRNRKIGELSGGQQQRVLIARSLISKPKLLILDEPTANIDAHGQTNFYKLLKELNKNTTIIIASHDLIVLTSYAKSVVCINQLVYFHKYNEISNEILTRTYGYPVELLSHGVSHRVVNKHWKKK